MRRIRSAVMAAVVVLVLVVPNSAAAAGEPIVPGAVRVDATPNHIGVVWEVTGDTNLNSTMTLEFREQGTSTWYPGAPSVRAYPDLAVNGAPLGLDSWGASALFLDQGTTYELRLTLTDPDGGGEVRVVAGALSSVPAPDLSGRDLYVVPGSGGGSGTAGNPFQGLQAAADAAQPGDVLNVATGVYAPFELTTSGTAGHPISFVGPDDGIAVVDGGGINSGVVTIGRWDQTTGHVIVRGLTIQDGRWGIDAQNTHNLLIELNHIRDVDFGVYNRRGNGWEHDQIVCDNTITGRTPWPGSGIPSERGIDLRGTGNVACHNTVQFFGDCVSIQPFTGSSYGNDVFGNDVAYCVDDGIEVDYNQANVRVWRNRVTNARMGVSLQPVRGGPAYVFRNELFNLESVPFKMHNDTTGFVVVHNTAVKHGDGHGDNGAMWRNATFRNNLILGTRYAFEFTTVADEGFRDFDYNGWGTTRAVGGSSAPYFKWDNVRYDRIGNLPAGVEDHGTAVGFGDLVAADLPTTWDVAAPPGTRDLRLVSGSGAVNAGVALDNLNDPFAVAGVPDLGAFEYGVSPPGYGPRATSGVVIERWWGPNRYATAAATAHAGFPTGAATVYVATGVNHPDAMAAVPLAYADDAPILLTAPTGVPAATLLALERLGPTRIVVLGGTGAVSQAVVGRLDDYAPVQRIAGANRYETAVEISKTAFGSGAGTVFVANGDAFADALPGGVAASLDGGPVLLVQQDSVPAVTAAEIVRLDPTEIVVLGGEGVVSQAVAQTLANFTTVARLAGPNRYATAVEISQRTFEFGAATVYLATGSSFADALVVGPIAAAAPGPVLLVERDRIPGAVAAELRRLAPSTVVILGGTAAVAGPVEAQLLVELAR